MTAMQDEINAARLQLRRLRAVVVCPQTVDGIERLERTLDKAERELAPGQDHAWVRWAVRQYVWARLAIWNRVWLAKPNRL